MYKIKQIPEDFIVDEVNDTKFDNGRFFCYWMKKRNYNTLSAVEVVAKYNNLKISDFSWAGNKDKMAVTTQLISTNKKLNNLSFDDIEISFAGNSDSPVSLGFLRGNHFKITIRDIDSLPDFSDKFINYFGVQRFSENNIEVGKSIIKKDFAKTVEILNLDVSGNNFINAISHLPKKILSLYVHAYQSFIWNSAVNLYLEDNPNFDVSVEIPIVGFGTQDIDKYSMIVLEKEGISKRDFVIRSLPDLSSEGSSRKIWTQAKDLIISELVDDDLNQGKKKVLISFFLDKGVYATEFLRQNFENK